MSKYVCKRTSNGSIILLREIKGLNFNPSNSDKYGIKISKIIIVNPTMARKLLVIITKRKLEKFLHSLALISDDDSQSDDSLREALNDLSRFRNIVEFKYRKYLENKYREILIAKIDILEGELKKRILYGDNEKSLNKIYEEEMLNYRRLMENMYFNKFNSYENSTKKSR